MNPRGCSGDARPHRATFAPEGPTRPYCVLCPRQGCSAQRCGPGAGWCRSPGRNASGRRALIDQRATVRSRTHLRGIGRRHRYGCLPSCYHFERQDAKDRMLKNAFQLLLLCGSGLQLVREGLAQALLVHSSSFCLADAPPATSEDFRLKPRHASPLGLNPGGLRPSRAQPHTGRRSIYASTTCAVWGDRLR